LACETGAKSRPIYDYAMPRGNVGLIVGNERNGIPGRILKKVHEVISIPMRGRGLSSVNVAKPSRKEMLSVCNEIHPDDGVDPRELARAGRPGKDDRKARQLCRQVAETLSQVLSGECGNEVLQGLQVMAVDPAPDAAQLVVTVRAALPGEVLDPDEVQAHIAAAMGKLRREVAAAITRKRAPTLIFRVL
jgi:ribosome-binding factor A